MLAARHDDDNDDDICMHVCTYEGHTIIFQTFFRMSTFIDSKLMKL